MKKVLFIFLIMIIFIVGCTSTNSVKEIIDIRGNIKSIYIDKEVCTINLDGKKEGDIHYLKASVDINKDTIIENKSSNKVYNIGDLEIGMTVEVIFNNSSLEDNILKGTAKIIKIINE